MISFCYLQNKSHKRRIVELENSVIKLTKELEEFRSGACTSVSHIGSTVLPAPPDSRLSGSVSRPPEIGRDEYNKSSQTIETAFVPCESCHNVEQNLRAAGSSIIHLCQTQGLPSSLAKYKADVEDYDWLTANDVAQWTAEQNKDVLRVNKHLEQLMATIEPLKADLAKQQKKNSELHDKLQSSNKEVRLEREGHSAQQKQYENKIKEIEKNNTEKIDTMKRKNNELTECKSELEKQLTEFKSKLQEQEELLQQVGRYTTIYVYR